MDAKKTLYPSAYNPLLINPNRPLPKEVAVIGAGTIGPDIGYYLKSSLPGIKLTYLQVPPQELPRRANTLYFQIDHHGDPWAQVQHGNNLALYWDAAPEDLKAELMVVGRS